MVNDLPLNPLFVTTSWDDGHPSDLRIAALLGKYGLSGTFYVPSSNSEGRPVMRPSEIAQLGHGFEIGGHTREHVSLTAMAPAAAAEQIHANKVWLEDILGRQVNGFAYVRGHHNRGVRELVDRAGFHYARTVKNLMDAPGRDRLQVPTTTQFFAHPRSTYVKNFINQGPTIQRMAMLKTLMGSDDLVTRCLKCAEACALAGGYFHLWGHAWELDEHDLWGDFEFVLNGLRGLNAQFSTNANWCSKLTVDARASAEATNLGARPFSRALNETRIGS